MRALLILPLAVLSACAARSNPTRVDPDEQQRLATAEQAAYDKARPILEKHCARCHTSGGAKSSAKKLDHLNMDSYPFGGHHAEEVGETIRYVLGVTGEEPEMPSDDPGAVKGAELEAIVDWTWAFDRAQAAGVH
jgi:mono/diheme cytochrome c family protein